MKRLASVVLVTLSLNSLNSLNACSLLTPTGDLTSQPGDSGTSPNIDRAAADGGSGSPNVSGAVEGGLDSGTGPGDGGPPNGQGTDGAAANDASDGAAANDASDSGGSTDACAGPVTLTIAASRFEVDLGFMLGYPACAVDVTLVVSTGVTISASNTSVAALWVHGLAPGSTVTIDNRGRIIGAGGAGGSGGNGGGGGTPNSCARPGAPGGPAVRLDQNATFSSVGLIFGGGGGGGGVSGGNQALGGGGGAGSLPGPGGAPATTLGPQAELAYCGQDNGLRTGTAGAPGVGDLPGGRIVGPNGYSGAGGTFGVVGEASSYFGNAPGGAGGHAIELRSGASTNVPTGYPTTGAVRGEVGPVP